GCSSKDFRRSIPDNRPGKRCPIEASVGALYSRNYADGLERDRVEWGLSASLGVMSHPLYSQHSFGLGEGLSAVWTNVPQQNRFQRYIPFAGKRSSLKSELAPNRN